MKSTAALLLIAIAGCASAVDVATLPLEKGTYILDGAGDTCEAAPNAATLYFDGNSILGPHGEPCTSKVASVNGQRYQVEMACIVLAKDGTVMPELKSMVFDINNRTSFTTMHGQDHMKFHRCGAYAAALPLHAQFGAN